VLGLIFISIRIKTKGTEALVGLATGQQGCRLLKAKIRLVLPVQETNKLNINK